MEKEKSRVWVSEDNPSIQRIEEKCINCGMCARTCKLKTGISYEKEDVNEPICVNCGQCTLSCPTGALVTKYDYKKVLNYIHDTDKVMVISVAPAVRVAIGEEFGFEPGTFLEGKLVSALKELGFTYVFDVTFGADLTVIEEANELVSRLKNKTHLPQFTSCCPSWVKYVEMIHPELINNLSTTKSPVAMQASIIRTFFRRLKDIEPEDIINVIVVPCVAKKYEIKRSEVQGIDFAITTAELAMMIRESSIDFKSLEEKHFDTLLSKGSGAGLIFGSSGGVMEAALRTAYTLVTNKKSPDALLKFENLRTMEDIKTAEVEMGDYTVKVAAVNGLVNFEKIYPELNEYDFIEVMNCKGGCIGGGGQPIVSANKLEEALTKRMESLQENSDLQEYKCSHNNPDIQNVYKIFLDYPNSETSKALLHTTYEEKDIWNK